MAGIDKTYFHSREEWEEAKKFVESKTTSFYYYFAWKDQNDHRKGKTLRCCYYKDWFPYWYEPRVDSALEKHGECVLWNTPGIFNYCISKELGLPSFIQERLKQQYGDEVDAPPVFNYPIGTRAKIPHRLPNYCTIYVTYKGEDLYYSYEQDNWNFWSENVYYALNGDFCPRLVGASRRMLARKLRMWKLPKGAEIKLCDSCNFRKVLVKITVK